MTETQQMINAAFNALNTKHRILAPASEARVIWADFDPCRARQVIARVEWPAFINCREVVLVHIVHDGDEALDRFRRNSLNQ